MLGHRRPLEQQSVPHLGLPLAWVLEAQANKQTWLASMPQTGISQKIEYERKEDTGEPVFPGTGPRNWSILYFPGKAFIHLVVHRYQWIIQSHAGSAALTLIETRLSLCILSCKHRSQVIYIIFWPGSLLAFYGPFLIRVCQPKNLLALKVLFLLKSGATLRKY